ncbi:beta-glucosidase [Draconibacterium sp. IB214405]|uniref:beta-glucosidase n=1 Tax=Draconibacterium sp. IB214405 TaxID=3097352 RepID=UPI002A0B425B|nr:beta-glucosidase [Draconibacterium sp. IB214405]MDX8338564.1 beta-glucosidase [Draconibacterium sp. IB214405]
MKKRFLAISIALFLAIAVSPKISVAQDAPQLGKDPIEKVIGAMTIEEKAHILIGTGMAGFSGNDAVIGETQSLVPGAAGTTYPIPRLGVPAVVLADGPAGLRISPTREGDENTYYCTGFPVGTVLASTWNTELVEQVGTAMGNEVLEYGADVLLAPALNIQRNPLNGRNFEYYSEDPIVSGKIAAAMVRGVQSNGVGTSIKHFVANNQETNRTGNDSRVSPRAMRELYLKSFEIAVKESQPWTVMSSYNYVNGVYTSERKDLLTDILREEWGFKGLVMTDWFGGTDAVAQIEAGNDLLEPGRPEQFNALVAGMKSGKLSMEDVDVCVNRVLELVLRSPRFKAYEFSNKPDLKKHAEITRQSAAEGMILLENKGEVLPLSSSVKKVAAFGITSYDLIAGGTGSGDVNKAYTVSLIEGMTNAGYKLSKDITKSYEEYLAAEAAKNEQGAEGISAFLPKVRPDEFIPSEDMLAKAVKANDVAIITIGRISGEFMDRKLDRDFLLSENEIGLISAVSKAFQAAGKKSIVILNIGGVIETASWKNIPDAVLLAGQAGQEGGNTIADALTGKVNPSGKLTATYPVKFEDHWSSENFPATAEEQKLDFAGFMSAERTVSDKRRNVDFTVYAEGIYVGYRYFEKYDVPVSYPFGYGQSYTTFAYGGAKLSESNGEYTVTVSVKNTGDYAGKEVVQLYVSAPESKYADKPVKELKAFAKTAELQPGESETVTLTFSKADVASFNTLEQAWITDAGDYKVLVGASSADIKAELPFAVSKTEWMEKVHKAF